jgi:beta-lactamase class A
MRASTSALIFGLLLLAAATAPAQPADAPEPTVDANLQDKLKQVVEGFEGDVGIYARHLPSGRTAAIRADSLFPTASMIKVPILIKTFDAIEHDTLGYHDTLTYRDSLYYPGVDLLGHFKDGAEVTLSKVVMLMMTMSDNTGALWLQHLCGTGTAINDWLATHGFEHTRMNSRTPGRHDNWKRYGWGQTTPREMARLLVMIHEGRAVSPAASDEMYRTLTRTYWDDEALSQIPPTVQVASKQGAVDESRSEVAVVNAPHGSYVFSVITKNQADTSWTSDNAGFELIRDVSHTLWTHFEPESDWRPTEGIRRYRGSTPE